jgi:adenylate kinase
MVKVVFLGPPGGGKGSQAQRIAPALGIPHISTGAMLRQAIADGTEMGLKAKAIVESGALVPDDVMIGLIKERIAQSDCAGGYLLDGFPRTIAQAQAFDAVEALTHVFNIDVPEDVILQRLTGRRTCTNGHTTHLNQMTDGKCPVCGAEVTQRDDDKPETVKNRLTVYQAQTAPLIDHYKALGILCDIDGDGPYETVEGQIMKVLS